jgi:hypothetical protein
VQPDVRLAGRVAAAPPKKGAPGARAPGAPRCTGDEQWRSGPPGRQGVEQAGARSARQREVPSPRCVAAPPALLCLALLSACGGDSSGDGGGDDKGLPKAEFLTQAEKICADANTALDAEPEPTSPEGISPYFDKLLGIADDTTTELEQLAADQPDKAEVDKIFLTPLRGQVEAIQAYLPKAKAALEQGQEPSPACPSRSCPRRTAPP